MSIIYICVYVYVYIYIYIFFNPNMGNLMAKYGTFLSNRKEYGQ